MHNQTQSALTLSLKSQRCARQIRLVVHNFFISSHMRPFLPNFYPDSVDFQPFFRFKMVNSFKNEVISPTGAAALSASPEYF